MTPLARWVALLRVTVLAGALAVAVYAEDRSAQATPAGNNATAKVTDRRAALRGFLGTGKGASRETHEDVGYVSIDRARKVIVLHQFQVEGFVNTYAAPATDSPGPIVFTSEAIENLPAGWRARETYRLSRAHPVTRVMAAAGRGRAAGRPRSSSVPG